MTASEIKQKIESFNKKIENLKSIINDPDVEISTLAKANTKKFEDLIKDLENQLKELPESDKKEKLEEKVEKVKEKVVAVKKTTDKKLKEAKKKAKQESEETVTITIGGKKHTYTITECDQLFEAHMAKREASKKSTEKSEKRPLSEKLVDKQEVTLKQILADKSVKEKMESSPTATKKQLSRVESALNKFLEEVEDLLGRKIAQTQKNRLSKLFKDAVK